MLRYLRKKKSNVTYKIQRGPGGLDVAKVKVYLETREDDSHVYQNFRLVTSDPSLLKYFVEPKFNGYHELSNEMEKYYAGNGETIFFNRKIVLNNLVTIVFDKTVREVSFDSSITNLQFDVTTKLPNMLGCSDCAYYRKKNKKCLYYQQIGIMIKTNCQDFKQKEVSENGEEEEEQ